MPLGFQLLIAFVAGGLLGLAFGWLFGRGRAIPADDRLSGELREQLARRETELEELRKQYNEASNAQAAAVANRDAAEKLVIQQRELQERALTDLRDTFKALSADALKQSAPEFLRLANETFGKLQEAAKGDLAQRQESIKTLVEPLRQHLENYQKRLQQAETAQSTTLGEVKKQLETLAQSNQSLAQETQQFRMVLHSNQARGRWGEETLRRVAEAAGMSVHCDFVEQSKGDEGKPDLIVKLPDDRSIIVDAKVPDLDFLNGIDAAGQGTRSELLAAHAARLRATIKGLADRDYPKQFPKALDHVVLFLPAESLFSTALEGDPNLIVWAESKGIYLATPATFIALLRTINLIWQQHAQTENAQKIAQLAQEFFARMVKFTEHFARMREGLNKAEDAFDEAARSFQSRVRPAGERLAELGGGAPGKELIDVQPLVSTPRLGPGV